MIAVWIRSRGRTGERRPVGSAGRRGRGSGGSLVGIAIAAVFLFPAAASAADWFVRPGGAGTQNGTSAGNAFPTVQAGLDALAGDPGGRLLIAPGTYAEVPSKTFTLAGTYTVTGDVGGTLSGVPAGAVSLQRIILSGATAVGASVVVEDLTATAASPGFSISSSTAKLASASLVRCKVTGGTGIGFQLNSLTGSATLADCTVEAAFGGTNGVKVDASNNATLTRVSVLKTTGNAVGILASDGTGFFTMDACTVRDTSGKLVSISNASNVTITNSTLSSNADGDGLLLDTVNGARVEGNVLSLVPAAAIRVQGTAAASPCQNILVQGNVIHDRSTILKTRSNLGIHVSSDAGAGTKNVTVKNNLIFNMGASAIRLGRTGGVLDGVGIFNNTCYQYATPVTGDLGSSGSGVLVDSNSNIQNVTIRYNLLASGGQKVGGGSPTTGSSYGLNLGASAVNVVHSHNLFCNNKTAPITGGTLGAGESDLVASTLLFIGGNNDLAGASGGQGCDAFNNPTRADFREFRLPQASAGGGQGTSPAVNAGNIASGAKDPADTLAGSVDLSARSTRTDSVADIGALNLGFHFAGATPGNPSVSLSAVPTSGQRPLAVTFTGSATDADGTALSGTSVVLDFGDGSPTANATGGAHTYVQPTVGAKTATLTGTDSEGRSSSASVAIDVQNTAPVANAQSVVTNEATPVSITLTGSDANGDPLTFEVASDPSHGTITDFSVSAGTLTYTPAAAFVGADSFTFKAKDPNAASAAATVSIEVKRNVVPPTAVASATPTTAPSLQPIAFKGSVSSDSDGTVVKWEWNFGDGTAVVDATATSGDVSRSYARPGAYTATLTVTDNDGLTAQASVALTITNVAPTAVAQATPQEVFARQSVSFSAAGSADPDGTIVKWEWDFGDGLPPVDATATSGAATRTYPFPGTYTVKLTVTDNLGATATASLSLTVKPIPPVALLDHAAGPAPDAFTGAGKAVNVPLFRFRLAPPETGPATIESLVFRLSDVRGLVGTDFTDLVLVEDTNGDGLAGATETTRFPGRIFLGDGKNEIEVPGPVQVGSEKNFILQGTVAVVAPGDAVRIDLGDSDISAVDGTSGPLSVFGSSDSVLHEENVPAGTFFVSTVRGDDANRGTKEAPWKTLTKAAASVPPASKVLIEPGTYPGGVILDIPGRENLRIVFEGDQRAGEVVVDAATLAHGFRVKASSGFVSIVGMTIKGPAISGVVVEGAPSVEVLRVKIQDFGGKGVSFESGSTSGKVLHSELAGNGIGIQVASSDGIVISDVLVRGSSGEGVKISGTTNAVVRNVTSFGNQHGIDLAGSGAREISDSIIVSNSGKGILVEDGAVTLHHNDVFGNGTDYFGTAADPTSFSADPLFVDAPAGIVHLAQIASGQAADSPAVNAGSAEAEALGLSDRTTRTDGEPDRDVVDIGYHYPIAGREDLNPPAVILQNPATGFSTKANPLALDGIVFDDRSPHARITVSASVAGGDKVLLAVDPVSGKFTGSVTLPLGIRSEVRVFATDEAGNVGTDAIVAALDKTAPDAPGGLSSRPLSETSAEITWRPARSAAVALDFASFSPSGMVPQNLHNEMPVYVNSAVKAQEVQPFLELSRLLETIDTDSGNASPNYLQLVTNRPAAVYVGYDPRASSLPAWLSSGFEATGLRLKVSADAVGAFSLFARPLRAGEELTLGGNMAAGGSGTNLSQYVIFAVPQETASDVAGFHIYRKAAGGSFERLTASPVPGRQFTDSSITPGVPYEYAVTAVDGAGNESAFSAALPLRTGQPQIVDFKVSPSVISPDGDGANDTATASATLSRSSDWTVAIRDPSGAEVRTFAGSGTVVSAGWDGRKPDLSIAPDARYTVELSATAAGIGTASASAVLWLDTNRDADNDGVPDHEDQAPQNPDVARDSDGDGADDSRDAYPFDPARRIQPAMIIAPKEGSTYSATRAVTFIGMAFDGEARSPLVPRWLDGTDLAWSSSLDGSLGTGMRFSKILSVGEHVVTLTAAKSTGVETAQVRITVVAGPVAHGSPQIAILSPFQAMPVNRERPVFLRAVATDPTDGSLPGPAIQWTASPRSVGFGEVISLKGEPLGLQTYTATVTNSSGDTAAESITLNMRQGPVCANLWEFKENEKAGVLREPTPTIPIDGRLEPGHKFLKNTPDEKQYFVYRLGRHYDFAEILMGALDGASKPGTLEVVLDGKTVFVSPPLEAKDNALFFRIPVQGVDELKIRDNPVRLMAKVTVCQALLDIRLLVDPTDEGTGKDNEQNEIPVRMVTLHKNFGWSGEGEIDEGTPGIDDDVQWTGNPADADGDRKTISNIVPEAELPENLKGAVWGKAILAVRVKPPTLADGRACVLVKPAEATEAVKFQRMDQKTGFPVAGAPAEGELLLPLPYVREDAAWTEPFLVYARKGATEIAKYRIRATLVRKEGGADLPAFVPPDDDEFETGPEIPVEHEPFQHPGPGESAIATARPPPGTSLQDGTTPNPPPVRGSKRIDHGIIGIIDGKRFWRYSPIRPTPPGEYDTGLKGGRDDEPDVPRIFIPPRRLIPKLRAYDLTNTVIDFGTGASEPYPTVQIDPISISAVQVVDDGLILIPVRGTVTDAVVDVTEGDAADIQTVQIEDRSVPLVKEPDSARDSRRRPFASRFRFETKALAAIEHGEALVTVKARNVLGNESQAAVSIRTDVTLDENKLFDPSGPSVFQVDVPLLISLPPAFGATGSNRIRVGLGEHLWVVDGRNSRVQRFRADGDAVYSFGIPGTGPGEFSFPLDGAGIAPSRDGSVFVTDGANHRVQKFARDRTAVPDFSLEWGGFGTADGQFDTPVDIAVDSASNIYVLDHRNHRVQKFDASGAFLGKWGSEGTGDGQFSFPRGIAVDSQDRVYVADSGNNRIQKFASDGTFLLKFGTAGSGDGEFDGPSDVAVDPSGNIYVVDQGHHRVQKFDGTGAFVLKWGSQGTAPGQFQAPRGIAADASGAVYVSDTGNHRIQRFDAFGNPLLTFGELGTQIGQMDQPFGIAVQDLDEIPEDPAVSMKFTLPSLELGPIDIVLQSTGPFQPTVRDKILANVTIPTLGLNDLVLAFIETDAASLRFKLTEKRLRIRNINTDTGTLELAVQTDEVVGEFAVLTRTVPDGAFSGTHPEIGSVALRLLTSGRENAARLQTLIGRVSASQAGLENRTVLLSEISQADEIYVQDGIGYSLGDADLHPQASALRYTILDLGGQNSPNENLVNPILIRYRNPLDLDPSTILVGGRTFNLVPDPENPGCHVIDRPLLFVPKTVPPGLSNVFDVSSPEKQAVVIRKEFAGGSISKTITNVITTGSETQKIPRGVPKVRFAMHDPAFASLPEGANGRLDGTPKELGKILTANLFPIGSSRPGHKMQVDRIVHVNGSADLTLFVTVSGDYDHPSFRGDNRVMAQVTQFTPTGGRRGFAVHWFHVVNLKAVIVAIDGGGYMAFTDAVATAGPDEIFGKMFQGTGMYDPAVDPGAAPVLNSLPSVTYTNWATWVTGVPPERHGITGNAFFPRDLLAGAPSPKSVPFGSGNRNGIGRPTLLGLATGGAFALNVPQGAFDDKDGAKVILTGQLPKLLKESAKPYWRDARVHSSYVAQNMYGADPQAANHVFTGLGHFSLPRTVKAARAALEADQGAAIPLNLEPDVPDLLGKLEKHNKETAALLDEGTTIQARRVLSSETTGLPDVTFLYYPGPDTRAHGEEAKPTPPGRELDHLVTNEILNDVDPKFKKVWDVVRAKGYENATLVVVIADHGMVRTPKAVLTDKERGFPLGTSSLLANVYENSQIVTADGPAFGSLWRGGGTERLNEASIVHSPSGGMAQSYLRGVRAGASREDSWEVFPDQDSVTNVAGDLYESAITGRNYGDFRGALAALGQRGVGGADLVGLLFKNKGFASDYFVFDKDAGEKKADLGDKVGPANWSGDVGERINQELDDRGREAPSRSGDILLLMNTSDGVIAVSQFDDLPGWHGGPTLAESEVPMMWHYPAAEGEDDEHRSTFLEQVVRRISVDIRTGRGKAGRLRSRDFTKVLLDTLGAAAANRF